MEYQKGQSRDQLALFTTCLDDMVPADNAVRFIDAFIESLDPDKMGFKPIATQGRPPYHPADLLKLNIYGYIHPVGWSSHGVNRMRSSRRLEKECERNLEVIWLLKNLKPDHNTIARFRKDNPKAIRRVFRQSVEIARNFNLIGGMLIAGVSTKLRAQNSKKYTRIKEELEADQSSENPQLSTSDPDSRHHRLQTHQPKR